MTLLRGVYRNGSVHLREPLELPDNTEVDVAVRPVSTQPQSEHERIRACLLEAGIVSPRLQTNVQPPLSPEREAELAAKLAKAGNLSDLVIQERDE